MEVTQLENLKSLDISGNPISEIPDELSDLKNLRNIKIGQTNLSEEDEKHIYRLRPGILIEY